MGSQMSWFVYIVECADDTLYTGITNDLTRRIDMHNNGTGAKYTKARTPVKLLYSEDAPSRSEASKREYTIKKLSRSDKLNLLGG
jgi:putative endonuclease